MTKKADRRRVLRHAATATESTPTVSPVWPLGVDRQLWAAYGPMYPGSGLRWVKRYAEYRGTVLDPFRPRPLAAEVVDLTDYSEAHRRARAAEARALYVRVFGCPPPGVTA